MYISELLAVGLTENEAKVYIGLLRIGQNSVSTIISEAEISSGKIYETLDKLHKKGLVSVSTINGVKQFQSTEPQSLINYIEEQKKELNEKEETLKKIIPKLTTLQPQQKYTTELLIGTRSIKPLLIKLLNKVEKTFLAMGIRGTKEEKYNSFWWHITKEEIEDKNKKTKYLFVENTSKYYKKHEFLKNVETKTILTVSPNAIDIIDNHVLIFSYEEKELHCVHIHNPAIATSFRSFFESLWNVAE